MTSSPSETAESPAAGDAGKFVGRYSRYPDLTGRRQAEGGARLKGRVRSARPDMPLVTVLTVCWNAAATIGQTIRSVREQSYGNIEYLIVDGASSDATLDVIRRHEDGIDYFVSEPDEGIYHAMNKGLELAQGDFVLMLNADDWYTPRCVEKLLGAHRESGADFVSARANYMSEDGRFIRVQPRAPFDAGVDFRMPLRHETMLMPAWIYEREGGYDTSYAIIADRVKTAGLYWHGYSHHELQDPLLNFRMSGVSSTVISRLHEERRRFLTERFPGMAEDHVASLVALEALTPARLCEIVRAYRSGELRAAALAYARSLGAEGHPRWLTINPAAFDRGIVSASVTDTPAVPEGAELPGGPAPDVSVILPVYNAEDTLAECFEALLAQSLQNFEIIVLDDRTPDGSAAIIDAYAARDPRIRVLKNEVNIGLGATRNRGIAAARGAYIFHIDPDDTIPADALETLHAHAERHGSDMTGGAFRHEQLLLGRESQAVRKGMVAPGEAPVVNTTLAETPQILRATEGHWSYLYRAGFAARVFYPEDLRMGQDSIFLVTALARARSISVIDTVVYTYRANAGSAMNTYTVQKVLDEIEWRRRAWHELDGAGQRGLGDHLLFDYWNLPFFEAIEEICSPEDRRRFFAAVQRAFLEAGDPDGSRCRTRKFREIFRAGLRDCARDDAAAGAGDGPGALRLQLLSTSDTGGAGLAARRLMEVLRGAGLEARMSCVFPRSESAHVHRAALTPEAEAAPDGDALHEIWRAHGVLTRNDLPGLKAREMFSKPGSLVQGEALRAAVAGADVVNLHWISGMLDYPALPEILGDRPVVWTLHDMNAFTGGCHYSEGCEGYRGDCGACPLLGGADLAHRYWQSKRDAIAGLKNLHIVCPSQWLADCAAQSGIFKGRPVHVIPNPIPVGHFTPTNKLVARRRLGLPLQARLIAFGADSLDNRRKGGDILTAAIRRLRDGEVGRAGGRTGDLQGLLFGADSLDPGIPAHNMGYVSDPGKLSLIYAAADVFAFPSREDNAPQTVPEALLSGTPVVAFPVGNVPELVSHLDTGFIAAYGDADAFAEGLAWALADGVASPEALMRGVRAHVAARAYHDPQVTLDRYVALFREIAGAPRSGAAEANAAAQAV